MTHRPDVEQPVAVAEAPDDLAVGILDPLPLEPGDIGSEASVGADGARKRDLVGVVVGGHRGPMEIVVHLAERGRLVDQSGALIQLDEGSGQDSPERRDPGTVGETTLEPAPDLPVVVEGRPIASAHQFLAPESPDRNQRASDLGGDGFAARRGDDQTAGPTVRRAVFDLLVVGAGTDGGVEVRREGPRGRGPHQQGEVGFILERQGDMDGGILDFAIPEAHFGRRERGPALRPPPHDLLAAVEEPLAVQLGKRPPDALHVAAAVRDVGVFEVHPVPDAGGHLLPVADVAEDARLTTLDEPADPVGLDPGAPVDAELLLDLHFHREAVGIPAGDPLGPAAAHGLEPGEDVLEHPGQDMPVVRAPVRGRRPVVPDPGPTVFPALHRAFEDAAIAPEADHVPLGGGNFGDRTGGEEQGHGGQTN